jgi:hypothetical protein
MSADKKTPSTDEIEQEARAIGERLMERHRFMQVRKVDVIDGVALVERVDLVPCVQNSES